MATVKSNNKCNYHSPLDLSIKNKKLKIERKDKLHNLSIEYKKLDKKIIQHIQNHLIIDYNNNSYVNLNNSQFFLKKLDIHINSMHLINGKKLDSEINLYHVDYNNNVLIISILLKKTKKDTKHLNLLNHYLILTRKK